MSNSTELELEDIPGIGPVSAKKLREANILSIYDLAVCSAQELADTINCSKETAATMILQADTRLRETGAMAPEMMTGSESLKRREKIQKLSTGSTELDTLLKGGIETQAITEFYAEFGSGKTQLCHTLAILSTLPIEQGGLNSPFIFYIDTENTFRPERIKEICETRDLDYDSIAEKILHFKAFNSSEFEYLMKKIIGEYIEKYRPKLIIIDGILSQHRADYPGRGTLADRQQKLHSILSRLKRQIEVFDIACVITNQVHGSPDAGFLGDPVKATGGHVVAHSTTYRLQIRKGSKTTRIIKMMDSPYHAYGECRLKLSEKGIEDLE